MIGFVESAGARMQEGLAALAGYARIFRQHVALSGLVPQISVICGASRGRRLLRAGAHRLRDHDREREHVPDRPRRRREGDRRGRRRRSARRPPRPRPQRRLPPRRRRPTSTRRCSPATCSTTCRRTPTSGRSAGPWSTRPAYAPDSVRARRGSQGLRRARRRARAARRRPHARDLAALGAQRRLRLRPPRRAARSGSSPTSRATSAACSTSTPRRRRRASCAPATCSGSRCSCSSTRPASCPGTKQEKLGVIRQGAKLVLRLLGVHRAARDGRRCARRSAAPSSR